MTTQMRHYDASCQKFVRRRRRETKRHTLWFLTRKLCGAKGETIELVPRNTEIDREREKYREN